MDSYPYSSWYLGMETVEEQDSRVSIIAGKFRWPFDSRVNSTAYSGYYNDEGVAEWRRYQLSPNHWLGLDGIPQLIEDEYDFSGEANPIAEVVWRKYAKVREMDALSGAILDRGTFFSRSDVIKKGQTVFHNDAWVRDLGTSLPTLSSDRDVGYNYIRNQLVLEGVRKDHGLPYLPLSVLLELSKDGKDVVSLIKNEGKEAVESLILIALLNSDRVKTSERGLILDGRVFVDRSGSTSDLFRLAKEVMVRDGLARVEGGRELIILADLSLSVADVSRRIGDRDATLYILSRLPGDESGLPIPLRSQLEEVGLQYRGTQAYVIGSSLELRYPIWLFRSSKVNVILPIPRVLRQNREDVLPFVQLPGVPFLAPNWHPSTTSTGGALLRDNSHEGGIETFLGINYPWISRGDVHSLALNRRGGERLFFSVPLFPRNLPRGVEVVMSEKAYRVSQVYHKEFSYTTLIVYEGNFAKGAIQAHPLPGEWSLSSVGDRWFVHSKTATVLTPSLFTELSKLQRGATARLLRTLAAESEILQPLSYSAVVRNWNLLRYHPFSTPTSTLTWLMEKGETRTNATDITKVLALVSLSGSNETGSLLARNEFGLLDVYSLPVAHPRLHLGVGQVLPLSSTQKDPYSLYFVREGRRVVYREDVVGVDVQVTGGLALFSSPFGEVSGELHATDGVTRLLLDDGIYRLRLSESRSWIALSTTPSRQLTPSTIAELLDYYGTFLYRYQVAHLMEIPAQLTRRVYTEEGELLVIPSSSPAIVSGDTLVIVRVGEEKNLLLMLAYSSRPERILAAYEGDTERISSLTAGRIVLTWEAISLMYMETVSTVIRASQDQLIRLASTALPVHELRPRRTLIASEVVIEGTITRWYREWDSEPESLRSSQTSSHGSLIVQSDLQLDSDVFIYRVEEEGTESLLRELRQVDEADLLAAISPNHLVLRGPVTAEGVERLKRQYMRAMFG